MPSVKFTQDTFMQARPRYMSLGSILSGTPPGKEMVPLFGRQLDDALSLSSGTYNINTTRNKGTTISSLYGLAGQALTVQAMNALGAASVGQYIYHDTLDRAARIIEVGAGVQRVGSVSGPSNIISGLGTTSDLRVGQYVSATSFGPPSTVVYIEAILSANQVRISMTVPNGADQLFTFGSYINTNKTVVQPSPDVLTATVQPTRYTRSSDMPFSRIASIDAQTITVSPIQTFSNSKNFHSGDVVLIINMSGDSSNFANVGNYEFAIVKGPSGLDAQVVLRSPLTRIFGVGSNTNLTGQTVMMYRVPEYSTVSMTGGVLTANGWVTAGQGFAYGGVIALMADYIIASTSPAAINASQIGYRRDASITPYFDSRVTRDSYLQKMVMGNAGDANGSAGGGIVFIAGRQIDDLTISGSGSNSSAYGASGGSCVVVSENIKKTSGIILNRGTPAIGAAVNGVSKFFYRQLAETFANEDADGPGLFAGSTPLGYKQTL